MVEVNSVYTMTTLQTGQKGTAGKIPLPADFPLPYKDNFDGATLWHHPDDYIIFVWLKLLKVLLSNQSID